MTGDFQPIKMHVLTNLLDLLMFSTRMHYYGQELFIESITKCPICPNSSVQKNNSASRCSFACLFGEGNPTTETVFYPIAMERNPQSNG